jgi:hypothetical protein
MLQMRDPVKHPPEYMGDNGAARGENDSCMTCSQHRMMVVQMVVQDDGRTCVNRKQSDFFV